MAVTVRERALVVGETLVVADCHLGKGEANIEMPVGDTTDVVDRFTGLLDTVEPATAVIAGDLLHSFSTLALPVREAVETMESAADERDVEMVVTPGNHDTMLEEVWDGPTPATYRVGDTVILHGHEAPTDADGVERYVIGHEHPALVVEGQRHDTVLVGEDCYRGADLIVLPAFNRLLAGVVVNEMRADEFMSPLVTDADALAPQVPDGDDVLDFPPLGELREHL